MIDIGEGDEVIVASNVYIACVMGITINGAVPIFVEPDETYNIDVSKIECAVTNKTKALLAVHFYGRSCAMDSILAIAEKYNIVVVEDCAQAHDIECKGQTVGTFCSIGCLSFYPTKGLGRFGDSGAIVTNNDNLDKRAKQLRN